MKLAERILTSKKVIDEKVQNSFFDDINTWATKSKKVMKFENKNAKQVVDMLLSIALSLDEVDEKGALDDIKKLADKIKKLDIEG